MLRDNSYIKDEILEPLEDAGKVSGFASPAQDYTQLRLNILEKLIKDPLNTYFAEADNDEMIEFGICKGTLFIYDTSKTVKVGSLVIIWHLDKWKVRQLVSISGKYCLITGKQDEVPILVEEEGVLIKGVVTWSCRPHFTRPKNHVRANRL